MATEMNLLQRGYKEILLSNLSLDRVAHIARDVTPKND